jgi:hypothetical protein
MGVVRKTMGKFKRKNKKQGNQWRSEAGSLPFLFAVLLQKSDHERK